MKKQFNMTLNITVVSSKCIYQCADYMLTDSNTRQQIGTPSQKLFTKNGFKWNASICYSGVAKCVVGQGRKIDTEKWLSNQITNIGYEDSFEQLIDLLLSADDWLQQMPPAKNDHSFSVGGFICTKPIFVLISNQYARSSDKQNVATKKLVAYTYYPTKPKTYVYGSGANDVSRPSLRRLQTLAQGSPNHEKMFKALAEINQNISDSNPNAGVSKFCCTSYLTCTGNAGTLHHGIDQPPLKLPMFGLSEEMMDPFRQEFKNLFGREHTELRPTRTGFFRSALSVEEHEARLREKPLDPGVHNNYGAYLRNNRLDNAKAELAFRKAIKLNPTHVDALGNLALLYDECGKHKRALCLYKAALSHSPGHINTSINYAEFLVKVHNNSDEAQRILDLAIKGNSGSDRLHLLQGDLKYKERNWPGALEQYLAARKCGGDQCHVETGIAYSLHNSGAPIQDCIKAYRTALTLVPKEYTIMLNLAQLIFISGSANEAKKLLDCSMLGGINESAQLEAHFYTLAHTSYACEGTFQKIKSLLEKNILLEWDVRPNIEFVRKTDRNKAELLEALTEIMSGQKNAASLGDLVNKWKE